MADYWQEKIDYMNNNGYEIIDPLQFYREIFPEGSFEKKGINGIGKKGNGMLVYKNSDQKTHTNIVFDDFWEIEKCINNSSCYRGNQYALMSMCSYLGKNRSNKNAYECFGFAIDIDSVNQKCLENFLYQTQSKLLITPTFIVMSGNGIHAYYVFDHPIWLTWERAVLLKELKELLTFCCWNKYTSTRTDVEFQGITQCYRMPGSKTKQGHIVTAYRIGKKVDIESVIIMVGEMSVAEARYGCSKTYKYEAKYQAVRKQMKQIINNKHTSFEMIAKLCYDIEHIPLEKAKELFPEWYERKVINREPSQHWTSGIALYNWWYDQIQLKAAYGGRYYAIYGLTAFAQRCNVPFDKLKEDAYKLIPILDTLTPERDRDNKDAHFTKADVDAAIKLYFDADLTRTSKRWLSQKTLIKMPDSKKRNFRSQDLHLKICRNNKKTYEEAGVVYDKGGRPSKELIIKNYLAKHPDETNISKIAQECSVSRNTVYKYFHGVAS